ncbi:uncharacterized protein [Diadema setosum]|uniref:uncharacterized protein n=1 Tax=Diadema setosum TaxID=31175 RepID=UPI003B3B81AC
MSTAKDIEIEVPESSEMESQSKKTDEGITKLPKDPPKENGQPPIPASPPLQNGQPPTTNGQVPTATPPPMANGHGSRPTTPEVVMNGMTAPIIYTTETSPELVRTQFTTIPAQHLSAPPSPTNRLKMHPDKRPPSSAGSSSDEDKLCDHVPHCKTVSTPNIHVNSLSVGSNGTTGPVKRSVSSSPGKRPLGMSKIEVRLRGLSGYDSHTYSDSDLMGKSV